MKYLLWIVVLALIIWGAMSLFGGETPEANAEPIKIGFIAPLSGDAAVYGEPARGIIELAMKKLNEAGGVDGRMIEMIYEDGMCNGTDAANAMQKLANVDGVKYVIGGFCSGESLAVIPIGETAGVFMLSPGSSSPDLTGASPMYARNYPSDATQGAALAKAAHDLGYENVAFIQESTDYALGVFEAFDAAFEGMGGSTVREEFPTEESDFRTPLTKLRDEDPDALFISVQTPAAGERIAQQLKDLGWDVPLMVGDVLITDSVIVENNADVLEGALGAIFGVNEGDPKYDAFAAEYKSLHGVEVPFPSYGQTEYDALFMLADAIAEVGDDPVAVADWFHGLSGWEGVSGITNISEEGDRVGGHTLRVIKDGKITPYGEVMGASEMDDDHDHEEGEEDDHAHDEE